jgi:hypothetical protein
MRPLVVFFALIMAFPTAGQNGYVLADTAKEWNTLSVGIYAFAVCSPGNTTRETIGNPTEINGQTYFPVYLYSCSRTTHQREGVPHLLSRKSGVHGLAGSSTPLPQARRSSY